MKQLIALASRVGVSRSSLYYQPVGESEENLRFMRLIDEQFTRAPFYGSRKMTAHFPFPGARQGNRPFRFDPGQGTAYGPKTYPL
jgi:hypothetical protein